MGCPDLERGPQLVATMVGLAPGLAMMAQKAVTFDGTAGNGAVGTVLVTTNCCKCGSVALVTG